MNKKLVTVCWSYTVEVELPDGIGADELNDYSPEIVDIADAVVKEAASNLNWKDGVITDVVGVE
jgi:hypothetical protein